jgi:16S rRNA (adenine1518-N6/adenine1519-N6)-dimethyltransferase
MGHTPRKRFGQHFLQDEAVIQHLVDVIAPRLEDHLVEIGPGQGALTMPILKRSQKLDALKFDFSALVHKNIPLRIIGNLPYNISTPLIFHLLEYAASITDMHFMLQKEVVDRLAAEPGNSDYGRLSIMVQYHCQVTALFDVPPDAFYPPPKVMSSIVRLQPYHITLPHTVNNYHHFQTLVKQAFSQRRKTLRNCLKLLMTDEDWKKTDIAPTLRPEQLSVKDYVQLSNMLCLTTP